MWLTHYTHLQNIDVHEVSLKKLKDTRKWWSDVTLTAHSLTLSCLCTNVTLEVKVFWMCQSKFQVSMLPHAALFPPLFFSKIFMTVSYNYLHILSFLSPWVMDSVHLICNHSSWWHLPDNKCSKMFVEWMEDCNMVPKYIWRVLKNFHNF